MADKRDDFRRYDRCKTSISGRPSSCRWRRTDVRKLDRGIDGGLAAGDRLFHGLLSSLTERPRVSPYKFVSNPRPTLGVEIELNLVDSHTMALRSGASQILSEVPPELQSSIKPELLQCYIELNTKVCQDVAEVESRPGQKAPGRQRDRRPPRPSSFLGGHPSVFAVARSGSHAQRALPRLDPAASGDGPAAGDVRPACARRRRFGR